MAEVFIYEMIMDLVWHEDYSDYSRKGINNHVSNLRKKLKTAPDVPETIKSVHSVGCRILVHSRTPEPRRTGVTSATPVLPKNPLFP